MGGLNSITLEGWIGISVGLLFVILLLIGVIIVLVCCLRNRRKKEDRKSKPPSDPEIQKKLDKKPQSTWNEGGASVQTTPSKADRKFTEQTSSQCPSLQ
uniref:Uncharacterized protein n=1 Tax=Panagrolaimus sp. ES5 TaxID=591445 RepID=A0AC34FLV1_9BILA